MFSVDDSGISVDELMRRVRAEAQRRRMLGGDGRDDPAPGASPNGTTASWASFTGALATADATARVGERLPQMSTVRGFRRRLAVPLGRLILRAAQLVTRDQTTFNLSVVASLRAIAEALTGQVAALEQRVAGVREQVGRLADSLVATTRAVEERAQQLRLEAVQAAEEARDAMRQMLATTRAQAAAELGGLGATVRAEAARTDHLRTQLQLQERRLTLLLEEARRTGPAGPERLAQAAAREVEHLLDTFYVSFEDHFRGTREEIKDRSRHYLPIVREAGAGGANRRILDLGCGRGEWLEVLAENGLGAWGVDSNQAMVAETVARGLDVREDDALTHLRSLADGTLGAVTGMHIIEHLPFRTLVALLDETVRVLKPGGVTIFETPNPQNLVVGACQFWTDPTHRNPLHPYTMAFLAEARGLTRVRIDFLHPMDDAQRLPENGSELAVRLNERLFGPQDFAIVGYRP